MKASIKIKGKINTALIRENIQYQIILDDTDKELLTNENINVNLVNNIPQITVNNKIENLLNDEEITIILQKHDKITNEKYSKVILQRIQQAYENQKKLKLEVSGEAELGLLRVEEPEKMKEVESIPEPEGKIHYDSDPFGFMDNLQEKVDTIKETGPEIEPDAVKENTKIDKEVKKRGRQSSWKKGKKVKK